MDQSWQQEDDKYRYSYPKTSPQQIDALLQKLYQDYEIKVYDQFYKDQAQESSLFVKCPRISNDYAIWVGYCQECGQDHDLKYFKVSKLNQYFPVPNWSQIKTLDCEQFSRKASENFCRDLNVFIKQIENDKLDSDLNFYQSMVDQKIEQYSTMFDTIFTQWNGEEIFKKYINRFQGNVKILKCLCTNNKLYPWYGYCTHCKENPTHCFFVSFGGSQTPEPLPSQMKLRMVNFAEMKRVFMLDLKDKIWSYIQWKFFLSQTSMQNEINQMLNEINRIEHITQQNEEEIQQMQNELQKEIQQEQEEQDKNQESDDESKLAEQVFKPDIKFDTFYDIEIQCESILQLTAGQGWSVKIMSEQYERKRQIINKVNTVIVSFYGLYNKGKTFLASRLSNKNLPLGYSVSTVGLSALYPQDLKTENAIVFLDTAGTETPINYQKEDEIMSNHLKELQAINEESQEIFPPEKKRRIYEIRLKDRLLTEHFLQKFILSESDIILLVVDQLTKEEQRLIQKIKNIYENSEIIIVHNFSKLVTLDDVDKYIQIDVIESFEVQKQYRIFNEVKLSGICYVENRFDTQGTKLPDITHVIMAHDNSEAGKHYNKFCFHYLKNRILAVTRAKQFDIVNNLILMIKKHLPEIIDLPAEKFNSLKLQFENNKITTNLNSSSLKSISFDLLGDLKVIILYRYRYIIQLLLYIIIIIKIYKQQYYYLQVFKGGLDPKYSIVMGVTQLLLSVEIAGGFQATDRDQKQYEKKIIECSKTGNRMFEWHGFRKDPNDKMQYIILRGIKKDVSIEGKMEILYNGREKGEFRLIIPINPGICVLRDDHPQFEVKNGVAQLLYMLQTGNDEIDDFF